MPRASTADGGMDSVLSFPVAGVSRMPVATIGAVQYRARHLPDERPVAERQAGLHSSLPMFSCLSPSALLRNIVDDVRGEAQ